MIIGVPKEIKANENRVAATPADIGDLIQAGHDVLVETNAGLGSGFADEEYKEVGAQIKDDPADVWKAEMVRSEEHTSELQSRGHLVCRLLLEKKKKKKNE